MAAVRQDQTALHRRLGIAVYLAIAFALAWAPAWLLREAWSDGAEPVVTRLLASSLLYALIMGWQPLFAVWVVRRWIDRAGYVDHGLRPSRHRFVLLATVAPIAIAATAAVLAHLFGLLRGSDTPPLLGNAEPELLLVEPSLRMALALVIAFVVTVALLWVQAFSEELGWRGYFMNRLMEEMGPWRGVTLHGAVWGIWYAPFFLLSNRELAHSLVMSGSFVFTCMLLGTLLGWLRLRSHSVLPTTTANLMLTLLAGLPFLLQGVDVGLRGAAYGPHGWVPMVVALLAIFVCGCASIATSPPTSSAGRDDESVVFRAVERALAIQHGRDGRMLN